MQGEAVLRLHHRGAAHQRCLRLLLLAQAGSCRSLRCGPAGAALLGSQQLLGSCLCCRHGFLRLGGGGGHSGGPHCLLQVPESFLQPPQLLHCWPHRRVVPQHRRQALAAALELGSHAQQLRRVAARGPQPRAARLQRQQHHVGCTQQRARLRSGRMQGLWRECHRWLQAAGRAGLQG